MSTDLRAALERIEREGWERSKGLGDDAFDLATMAGEALAATPDPAPGTDLRAALWAIVRDVDSLSPGNWTSQVGVHASVVEQAREALAATPEPSEPLRAALMWIQKQLLNQVADATSGPIIADICDEALRRWPEISGPTYAATPEPAPHTLADCRRAVEEHIGTEPALDVERLNRAFYNTPRLPGLQETARQHIERVAVEYARIQREEQP